MVGLSLPDSILGHARVQRTAALLPVAIRFERSLPVVLLVAVAVTAALGAIS